VHAPAHPSTQDGVAIPIIVSEVEVVAASSPPVFRCRCSAPAFLLSVLWLHDLYAALARVGRLPAVRPQAFFIPMLQAAINRRTAARIKVLRALSVDIVKVAADGAETADERKYDARSTSSMA